MPIQHIFSSLVLFITSSSGADIDEPPAASTGLQMSAVETLDDPTLSTEVTQCEAAASEAPNMTIPEADELTSSMDSSARGPGYCYHDCSPCSTRDDCRTPEFPYGSQCTEIRLC